MEMEKLLQFAAAYFIFALPVRMQHNEGAYRGAGAVLQNAAIARKIIL